MKQSTLLKTLISGAVVALLSSCGGGGGGSQPAPYEPLDIVKYPYETVYGDACKTSEPTPGCTFLRSNGKRVTVSADPDYNQFGYGSDDLTYVKFNYSGVAEVYNDDGDFIGTRDISSFKGYISGNTIGVGTTGAFWETVSGKTYWLGENGVLYSAQYGAGNYGQAINNKGATNASNVNSKAIKSAANQKLIQAGADKLVKTYKLSPNKAVAIASTLNAQAVAGVERGVISERDMDKTFKTVFGVGFNEALATVNAFRTNDPTAQNQARALTDRTASHLGLSPANAKEFVKSMYAGAIKDAGLTPDQVNW